MRRVRIEASFDTDEFYDTEGLAAKVAILLGDVIGDFSADLSVSVWKEPVSDGPHFTAWSQVYPNPTGAEA